MSKLAGMIIGIIVFSMIIIGTTTFIKGFRENYDVDIEEGWEDTYNFIDNMTTISDDMMDVLESDKTTWAVSGLSMGYSVVKSMFKIPKFIATIFGNIAERLNLPPWIVENVIIIMVILLIFALAAVLVRWYI